MSIEGCKACGDLIDTDYHPQIYRDDINSIPVCDYCFYEFEHSDCKTFDEFLREPQK